MKPLYIPKDKREFGLKVYCKYCNTLVFDTCKATGEPLQKCLHPADLFFKAVEYEKNSDKRRTMKLDTRILKEALAQSAAFYQEVKEGKHHREKFQVPTLEKEEGSLLLIEAMSRYVDFLRGGESTPEHKRRKRGEKYCREVEKIFIEFIKSLKKHYNVKELTAKQVDQPMVGKFHANIESKNLGARSYNIRMTRMYSLYNHLIQEGLATINPFAGVVRKLETHNIEVLTKEEYNALLDIVQILELGLQKVGKEIKNFYRPWVKDGIQLGLMTGRRSEEIIQMRWKDIVLNNQGELLAVNATDFKVSRQQGRLEKNPKKISVPITVDLKQLLIELGYEKFKGSDKYILADDETMNRETMRKFMARSFTHYWKQLSFSKEATYKNLRKTYLSSLSAAIGISNAQIISQHSSTKILSDHYVSDKIIGQTAKNFSVFPEQNESRQNELHDLRKSSNGISLEK